MSNPLQNNEAYGNINQTEQNLKPIGYNTPPPLYTPVQPVQVVGGPQMVAPVAQQGTPIMVPYQYTQQPIIIQQQPNNNPQVIIVKEGPRRKPPSGRCCYCYGPKQSPCGCCDPNEEYCCILIVFAYILMSLRYILMCLCILSYCRSFHRHGCC